MDYIKFEDEPNPIKGISSVRTNAMITRADGSRINTNSAFMGDARLDSILDLCMAFLFADGEVSVKIQD